MQYYQPQSPQNQPNPQHQTPLGYGQPNPQQPQYGYPPYRPPMPPAPEELYKKSLRRTSNGLGALLIIFLGLELVVAFILEVPIMISGLTSDLTNDGVLLLLLNGVVSMIVFFVAALIYCLIRKLSFSSLFPFERVKGRTLMMLCTIGIAFSLMSNYVVDLVNNTFGLFGIQNNGGSFDAGSEPNVLLYFLTVAVMPALVEEFAFRGVVMGVLRPYSEGLAIVVSSAAFALMHGNFVQLPFTFCCGLVFAFIDIKAGSLLPSVIVHFLNNGLSVMADILVSYHIVDDVGANLIYGVIFVVTGILAFIFLKGFAENQPEMFKLKDGNEHLPYRQKVKTVASSPTMIVYMVLMLIYCIIELFAL